MTPASNVSTDARANAPGVLYSWNRSSRPASGMVLVSPAMRPETTYTAPNSPIARALHRMTPYSSPHLMFGNVTRQKICQPFAPRLSAASSSSGPIASITGINSRATNGSVTNVVAITSAGTVNSTSNPFARSHGPKNPCRPNSSTNTSPATTGETESGNVDGGDEQRAAGEAEAGDGPRRRDAEDELHTTAMRRDRQRQQDGVPRVGVGGQVLPVCAEPSASAS